MSTKHIESDVCQLVVKKRYQQPVLVCYGTVQNLTQGGGVSGEEGSCAASSPKIKPNTCASDRRAKENIVQVGQHPLGIGLYLFDYKAGFRDQWGHCRQFGVMADEVELVMPQAVCEHPDGYKMVNYALLGMVTHTIQ